MVDPSSLGIGAGIVASVAVITAVWARVKVFIDKIISLFIIKASFQSDVVPAIYYYCWSNYKRGLVGNRRFAGANEYIRSESEYKLIGWEMGASEPVIFRKGLQMMLVSNGNSDDEKYKNSDSFVSITFFRGTINIEKFVEKAIEAYNKRLKGLVNEAGGELDLNRYDSFYDDYLTVKAKKRFFIDRIVGQGSVHSRVNMGSNPSSTNSNSVEISASKLSSMLSINMLGGIDVSDVGYSTNNTENPTTGLVFNTETTELFNRADRWIKSKEWYQEKNIPWTMGIGLHGKPGTGKSSFVRALAIHLDVPLFVVDLASLSNSDLYAAWDSKVLPVAPCIVLFEDMDATFHGRENQVKDVGGGLTFDALLNTIGGVISCEGVLKVITTNEIDKIDPALFTSEGATRPGRIDYVIELAELTPTECEELYDFYFPNDFLDNDDKQKHLANMEGMTGAQASQYCQQLALQDYWAE